VIEPIPFSRIKPLVQRLGLLRLKNISKFIFDKQTDFDDGELVPPGEALLLILASILDGRSVVTKEQNDLIINEYGKDIVTFGKMIAEAADKEKLPVSHLIIVDRLFARISGHKDFLDLRTGNKTNVLEMPAIEIMTFDLPAMLIRTLNALK